MNRQGEPCAGCEAGSAWLCRTCWSEARRGKCPVCFTDMQRVPGRRHNWLHPATPCIIAQGAWSDRVKGGNVAPEPRIRRQGSPA